MDEVGFDSNEKNGAASVSWKSVKLGDKCKAFEVGASASASIQISGNFGEGGYAKVEVSNDGKTFVVLSLGSSENAVVSLPGSMKFIRPVLVSGDGESCVDFNLFVSRSR